MAYSVGKNGAPSPILPSMDSALLPTLVTLLGAMDETDWGTSAPLQTAV